MEMDGDGWIWMDMDGDGWRIEMDGDGCGGKMHGSGWRWWRRMEMDDISAS